MSSSGRRCSCPGSDGGATHEVRTDRVIPNRRRPDKMATMPSLVHPLPGAPTSFSNHSEEPPDPIQPCIRRHLARMSAWRADTPPLVKVRTMSICGTVVPVLLMMAKAPASMIATYLSLRAEKGEDELSTLAASPWVPPGRVDLAMGANTSARRL